MNLHILAVQPCILPNEIVCGPSSGPSFLLTLSFDSGVVLGIGFVQRR